MSGMQILTDALKTPRDWQPIATAPRDGTPILLWEKGLIGVFYWGIPRLKTIRGKEMPATWIGAIVLGDGLVERNIPEPIFEMHGSDATHWMLLPEGPEQNKAET